jgi:hypothetical protein
LLALYPASYSLCFCWNNVSIVAGFGYGLVLSFKYSSSVFLYSWYARLAATEFIKKITSSSLSPVNQWVIAVVISSSILFLINNALVLSCSICIAAILFNFKCNQEIQCCCSNNLSYFLFKIKFDSLKVTNHSFLLFFYLS